jgi:hypothetical protein
MAYKAICGDRSISGRAFKVIHRVKNLFCNVTLICNLVQEFNGLVSKGLAIKLALLLFMRSPLSP